MSMKNKKKTIAFTPDNSIAEKIQAGSRENRLPCSVAFKLSETLGVSKSEIGHYADYLNLKLSLCQIGLFGHGDRKKQVKTIDSPDPKTLEKIETLNQDGTVSCEDVFRIANELGTDLRNVGNVCQTINIKIKQCRLGAF